MITFLHGPQACGKTRHRQQFAEMHRASFILEDWQARSKVIPHDGDMVITCDSPAAIERFCEKRGITHYTLCDAPARMAEAEAMNWDRGELVPLADPFNRSRRKPYTKGDLIDAR